MSKYKGGLACPACGKPIKTKMEMIQDILRWTKQKPISKYSNAVLTSEQMFVIWCYFKGRRK